MKIMLATQKDSARIPYGYRQTKTTVASDYDSPDAEGIRLADGSRYATLQRLRKDQSNGSRKKRVAGRHQEIIAMPLPASTASDTPEMKLARTARRTAEEQALAECLDCPRCGADCNSSELREVPPWLHGHAPQHRVVCDCGLSGPTEDSIAAAVDSWNVRPDSRQTWPRPFAIGFVIGCLSSIAAAIIFILFTP